MGDQRHAPAALAPARDLVPITQEAGWAPGPVWTCVGNFTSHRNSTSGPPSPWRGTILTELSRRESSYYAVWFHVWFLRNQSWDDEPLHQWNRFCMLSCGWFTGVCSLYTNVSEHFFHLHRLWRWKRQSVPKRWHLTLSLLMSYYVYIWSS
jgi:hypothetical protein